MRRNCLCVRKSMTLNLQSIRCEKSLRQVIHQLNLFHQHNSERFTTILSYLDMSSLQLAIVFAGFVWICLVAKKIGTENLEKELLKGLSKVWIFAVSLPSILIFHYFFKYFSQRNKHFCFSSIRPELFNWIILRLHQITTT